MVKPGVPGKTTIENGTLVWIITLKQSQNITRVALITVHIAERIEMFIVG